MGVLIFLLVLAFIGWATFTQISARQQTSVSCPYDVATARAVVAKCFGRSWASVDGKGDQNYKPRVRARAPVISVSFDAAEHGSSGVEIWCSAFTKRYGLLEHGQLVWRKKRAVARALSQASLGSPQAPAQALNSGGAVAPESPAEARARETAEQAALMQARFQALRDHVTPHAIALVEKELGVALSPEAWNAIIDPDDDRNDYLEIKLDGVRIAVRQEYGSPSLTAVQQPQVDPALRDRTEDRGAKGDTNSFKFRGVVWNSEKQKMEPFTRTAFGEALRAIRPGIEIPDVYEPEVINEAKVIHFDRPEGLKAAAADATSEELCITTTEDEWEFYAGDETSDHLRYVEHHIIPGRLWLRVTGFLGDDGKPKVSPQIWCPTVLGENNWLPMSQATLQSVRSMLTAGPGGGPLRVGL